MGGQLEGHKHGFTLITGSAPSLQRYEAVCSSKPFAWTANMSFCSSPSLASFCRETPEFMLACVSSPIKLGTTDDRCRVSPSVLTRFLSRFHELPRWTARGRNDLRRSLPRAKDRESQAAFRLRDDRSANRAAIFMRLLASTAAATHSSKRSRPSERQRFMPRPPRVAHPRPKV